jgi:hypothetical protein
MQTRAAIDSSPVMAQMAEREGFEPSNTFWGVTHFPGERLRPLGHLSTTARKRTGRGAGDQIYPVAGLLDGTDL